VHAQTFFALFPCESGFQNRKSGWSMCSFFWLLFGLWFGHSSACVTQPVSTSKRQGRGWLQTALILSNHFYFISVAVAFDCYIYFVYVFIGTRFSTNQRSRTIIMSHYKNRLVSIFYNSLRKWEAKGGHLLDLSCEVILIIIAFHSWLSQERDAVLCKEVYFAASIVTTYHGHR
jgi:hypothetical protein